MEDRIVQYPNRIKLVPVEGTTDTYDIVEVPGEVTAEGTPLNKATLMTDVVGNRYGLPSTGTLSQMFERNVQTFLATIPATGWSTSTTNGYYTNQVSVTGMKAVYNPKMYVSITSAELAEEERAAFGQIIECDTYDGYIIAKALEAPESDVKVILEGV